MKPYEKVGWIDHIVDIETGEVIQEGLPLSENNLSHMDDGIYAVNSQVRAHENELADLRVEVKTLKDATLNNMVNNVFVGSFTGLQSMRIVKGIYDPVMRRVYAGSAAAGREG